MFFNFFNQLFSGLFNGLGGGAGVAPVQATPQADPLFTLFNSFPDLGMKYGATGYAGHRNVYDWETPQAQQPAIEPITSLADAVTAPFADALTGYHPAQSRAQFQQTFSQPAPVTPIEPAPSRGTSSYGSASSVDVPEATARVEAPNLAPQRVTVSPRTSAEASKTLGPKEYTITKDGDLIPTLRDQGPLIEVPSVRGAPEDTSKVGLRDMSELRPLSFAEQVAIETGPNMVLAADMAESRKLRPLHLSGPPDTIDTIKQGEDVNIISRIFGLGKAEPAPETNAKSSVAPAHIPTHIAAVVDKYAEAAGIDKALAKRIVQIESSGNPKAVTGSYKGLFQLSRSEFHRFGGGDIFKAEDNARAGLLKLAAERDQLAKLLGRDVTPGEIYLAHQQGIGGAVKHLQNPDQPAWKSMYQTGEGRSKGVAWSKRAIWGNVPYDMRKKFGSVNNITSKQFVELWRRKVEG